MSPFQTRSRRHHQTQTQHIILSWRSMTNNCVLVELSGSKPNLLFRLVRLGPHEVRVRARVRRSVHRRAELVRDGEGGHRDAQQERGRLLPHGGGSKDRQGPPRGQGK